MKYSVAVEEVQTLSQAIVVQNCGLHDLAREAAGATTPHMRHERRTGVTYRSRRSYGIDAPRGRGFGGHEVDTPFEFTY